MAILCIAGVLPVSLAACGAGSVSGGAPVPAPVATPPDVPEHDPKPEPDPLTAYYVLPEGAVRVTGVVFSADEEMQPRRPFQTGAIIAMTRQRYDQFRVEARGPWKSALLNGRDFPLPGRLIAEPGVHRSDLDASGTYSLTIEPGDYVVCLGDLSEVDRDGAPGDDDVWIDKVFEATVTEDELQTIIPVLDRNSGELVLHH